jgi:Protein of unknown function (DUF2442)
MNTSNALADSAESATFERGEIIVRMKGGREIRFGVSHNPRLCKGTPAQLINIELSPYGLHWPELDEDLSYRGLREGDFGYANNAESTVRRRTTLSSKRKEPGLPRRKSLIGSAKGKIQLKTDLTKPTLQNEAGKSAR